jgi:hypothetical protein
MNAERPYQMFAALPASVVHGPGQYNLSADILAVIKAAARVEPDIAAIMSWYRDTPIAELGEMTAESLVGSGHLGDVLAFLRDIEDGHRE